MEAESLNGSTDGREERSFELGKRMSRWSVVAARRSGRLLIESKFKGGGNERGGGGCCELEPV